MLGWLQVLQKEWEMIKKAPWSFAIISALALVAIWTIVYYPYKLKLDDAHELTGHWMSESQRWESDAEYWKDMASHPALGTVPPSTPQKDAESPKVARPVQKDSKPSKTVGNNKPASEVPSSTNTPEQIVSAPNGIAVGGGTVSNPTVNNYGPQQRQLTPPQESLILSMVGVPPTSDFDGVYCIMGDQEGHVYAQQLWDVFSKAGWNVGKMVGLTSMTRNPAGLFIAVSPEDAISPPDGVMRVYGALKAAGINVMAFKVGNLQKNHWYVFVGNEPT
jgi:hypothetical protein